MFISVGISVFSLLAGYLVHGGFEEGHLGSYGSHPGSHFGGGFPNGRFLHGGYGEDGLGRDLGGYGGVGFGRSIGIDGPKYLGGSEIEHAHYNEGQQGHNGEHFREEFGNSGSELKHGELGYKKGRGGVKDIRGETAHFVDVDGGLKEYSDGKNYFQNKHLDKKGEAENEKQIKQGHKKGHTVRGFSSSHHKDESGKTEQFYDDEHDEGGNIAFDGHSGKFGETGHSSVKGGHEDGKFNSGAVKKGSHYDREFIDGKEHINHDHFGDKKYAGHESAHGEHKVLDEDDISGVHESTKIFKHRPTFY